MSGLTFITTQTGHPDRPAGPVSDLDIHHGADGAVVYATSRVEARITAFDLGTGTARYLDSQSLPGTATPLGGLRTEILDLHGTPHTVTLTATAAGLPRFALDAQGTFTGGLTLLRGPGLGPDLAALEQMQIAGRDWMLAAETGERGLRLYEMTEAGTLAAPPPAAGGASGSTAPMVRDLTTARIGDTPFVFVADDAAHAVHAYQMTAQGQLNPIAALGAVNGFGIASPSQIEHVSLGGQDFLILASAGSSSLSVLQISPNGALTPTDHLVDDRDTRFQGVSELEVVTAQGRVYVIAGGADDGVSLFLLRPDGRLMHQESLADQPEQNLQNVSGLAAAARGQGIDLFVGSATEAGVSQFRLDLAPGGAHIRADAAGGRRDGTDRADMLQGGHGKDDLRGGAGDDLLIDGFEADQLYGGAGADTFAFAFDDKEDTIRDFNPGEDRIDLSAWPMLRSVDQLKIVSHSYGGAVRYAGDGIKIFSAQGGPLDVEALRAAILQNFHHHPVAFLTADLDLVGTDGDDVLRGNGGNDMLNGGAGADLLIGGSGQDTAAYTGTKGAMIVDLVLPHLNTNTARGDRFEGIENLRGSSGSDTLRGDQRDNILEGGTNSDLLFGRGGADELRGGKGFDTLIGGPGGDLMKGGLLIDTADYSDSPTGLTVDLGQVQNNTGIARGDRFKDVENLRGSAGADALYGNGGDNRLMGSEGADALYGRGGQDLLIGGPGADRLDGGAGADVLRGGNGADHFVFRAGSGTERIADFFRGHDDRILLDTGLWTGLGAGTFTGPPDARKIVARFGEITGDGALLDFGDDTLLIERQTTWNGIVERIEFL